MIFVFLVARILTTWNLQEKYFVPLEACLQMNFKMHRSRVYKMLWLVKCSVAVCAEWDKDVWAEWEDTPGPSKVSKAAEGRRCSPLGRMAHPVCHVLSSLSGANFSPPGSLVCAPFRVRGLQRKADRGHGRMHLAIRHTETKTSELGKGLNFPEYPRKNSLS